MMKHLWLLPIAIPLVLSGCVGSSDGDVETAMRASRSGPKSADELPASMPPQARAAAASAIAQGNAMRQQGQDPARLHALEEMQKQRGH